MLNIYFGNIPERLKSRYVYNTSVYFDNTYLDSWITDPFSQKMIKDIDKAVVLSSNAVDSKALGVIPVKQLSGGVKTLILLKHDSDRIFNCSTCGDNCAKWILKIAEKSDHDLIIGLHHLMDFGEKPFELRIMNNDTIVHSMNEYVLSAGLFL